MSENLELGVIGQKYEDRKSGKTGTLESRDSKYKTMMFVADDGKSFSISNSTFRSNWRKVKVNEIVNDIVEDKIVVPLEVETSDLIDTEIDFNALKLIILTSESVLYVRDNVDADKYFILLKNTECEKFNCIVSSSIIDLVSLDEFEPIEIIDSVFIKDFVFNMKFLKDVFLKICKVLTK